MILIIITPWHFSVDFEGEGVEIWEGFAATAMAEQSNRWSWNITGFEPWKSTTTSPSPEQNDQKPSASRNSTYLVPSHSVASKVEELRDQVKVMRFHFHVYRILMLSNSVTGSEIKMSKFFGESSSGFCLKFVGWSLAENSYR